MSPENVCEQTLRPPYDVIVHGTARRSTPSTARQRRADPTALARLCALHRDLGVPDEDHIVRPVIARGRAADVGMGVAVSEHDLPAELTITADGAFWSPFGPTVVGRSAGRRLLLTRTTDPLRCRRRRCRAWSKEDHPGRRARSTFFKPELGRPGRDAGAAPPYGRVGGHPSASGHRVADPLCRSSQGPWRDGYRGRAAT